MIVRETWGEPGFRKLEAIASVSLVFPEPFAPAMITGLDSYEISKERIGGIPSTAIRLILICFVGQPYRLRAWNR